MSSSKKGKTGGPKKASKIKSSTRRSSKISVQRKKRSEPNFDASHRAEATKILKSAAEKGQATEQKHHRYRDRLIAEIAQIVVVGIKVKNDPKLFAAIVADPFWGSIKGGRPSLGKIDRAPRFLLRAYAGSDLTASKRASDYWAAVAPHCSDSMTAQKLEGIIKKAGGLAALAKANRLAEREDQAAVSRAGGERNVRAAASRKEVAVAKLSRVAGGEKGHRQKSQKGKKSVRYPSAKDGSTGPKTILLELEVGPDATDFMSLEPGFIEARIRILGLTGKPPFAAVLESFLEIADIDD